jgi:ribosomal protein S27E
MKVLCHCGAVLRYASGGAASLEFVAFVGDRWTSFLNDLDLIAKRVAAGEVDIDDAGAVAEFRSSVYANTGVKCSNCGRWTVFDADGKRVGVWEQVST